MHPLDEKNVRQSYPARVQTMAKAWQSKWTGAYEHTQRILRLLASGYYQKGYSRWHLVNLMNRGVASVVSYLVEGNPKVMIQSMSVELQEYAYGMSLILNYLIERNKFADEVLIPGAMASMVGDGIARTFYEYDRCVSVGGEKIKIGTPRVSIIQPCDYIGDPSAKHRKDFAIEGDVYRLPLSYAKDLFAGHDKFGNQIADYIEADCKLESEYDAKAVIGTSDYDWNKLADEEYATFMDIYNVRSRTIDTIQPMGHKAKVLHTVEWEYPNGSPYDVLGYRYLPDIPISLPPAWDWYDIDVTMNIIAKAAREQAESQKNVILVEPSGKETAKEIESAKNMDIIVSKSIDKFKELSLGGAFRENYSWLDWAERTFTKSGTASSDVLGGRGAQAETLGQEQLIYANATRIVNNFYVKFHGWMESVLEKWAWAVLEHPATYVEVLDVIDIPGLGRSHVPIVYSKADKAGEFTDLIFKVIPYSTQRTSPEQRYQRMFQLLSQWFLPTQEMRLQQGATLDIEQIDRQLAEYAGLDNFHLWYQGVTPSSDLEVKGMVQSKKADKTKETGMGNDSLGATDFSRVANMLQQQERAGFAGETTEGVL